MAVVIPAGDKAATDLNSKITNYSTLITNNVAHGKLAHEYTKGKAAAQLALVYHLLGTGRLLASSILANETYVAGPDVGGDQG